MVLPRTYKIVIFNNVQFEELISKIIIIFFYKRFYKIYLTKSY